MCLSLRCAYDSLEIHPTLAPGTAPSPSAPQCPDPVTVPRRIISSVQQFTGPASVPTPHLHFFVYSEFITQIFSPCLFSQIHKPQQFQIPWLCTFSKPHFEKKKKHKLITPPTHELALGKCKAKRKHEEENGRFTRIFLPPSSTLY